MSIKIDPYSMSALAVEQLFRGASLGVGTAFAWRRHDKDYLITNWHVVTLRNTETGKCIAAHGGEPDKLRVLFRASSNGLETTPYEVPLRDEYNRPTWLWHPAYHNKVDVVAIPLGPMSNVYLVPINQLPTVNLSLQIGMDVFVLGFPFGISPPSLPIWKRGSIASEPGLVRLAERHHLIDTASRPGMSGGPVVRRSYGTHLGESGLYLDSDSATRFLGVYSGRLYTKDSGEAQLGRVWPESFIPEIIDAAQRDSGMWS